MMATNKGKVIKLYKTLLFMGRDYPLGYKYFRDRCHNAFSKNRNIDDPELVVKLIGHAEYVVKELTALYSLKKYRTLKRRYYPEQDMLEKFKNIQDLPPGFEHPNKNKT